jgi:hypothetical protein
VIIQYVKHMLHVISIIIIYLLIIILLLFTHLFIYCIYIFVIFILFFSLVLMRIDCFDLVCEAGGGSSFPLWCRWLTLTWERFELWRHPRFH